MEKGYDAGKKVSGIKRHIAVDTQGLPVITIAGSSHFFHGKLIVLRDTIARFVPSVLQQK